MPIERGDVGAWVVKGNPGEKWSYFAAYEDAGRRPGDVLTGNWSLGRTQPGSPLHGQSGRNHRGDRSGQPRALVLGRLGS
jgi:hypothetical protein